MRKYIPILAIILFFLCTSQMYKASLPKPATPTTPIGETADTNNVRLLAKDGAYVSPTTKITDATSNGGTGGDVLEWDINLDIYTAPEAIFLVDIPTTGYYCVWVSHKGGDAFQLNTSDLATYTNASFGMLTNQANYAFELATNFNHTPKKFNFATSGNKKIYARFSKGTDVDGLYIGRTSDGTSTGTCNATPSLPSGIAPFVPDYTIQSYNAITVNHALGEDEWANAPTVSFATNPTNNTIDKFALLWDDTANRVCGAVQVTDQGTLRTDTPWYSSDHIEVVLSPGTAKQPSATETVKYAINADCSGTPQVSAYLWGAGSFATDWTSSASMSASCAYGSNIYTIEWCGNLPWNPAPEDGINFEVAVTDSDTLGPTTAIAFGSSVNDPASWGVAQFVSSTPPSPPPDTTAPTCTPALSSCFSHGTAAETTESVTVAGASDNQALDVTVTFQWGTDTSYTLGSYQTTVSSGQNASYTITGLTGGTLYHWRAKLQDPVGNTAYTDDDTFTTASSSYTYYIAPDGNDSTGDGSTGTPWKTWTKAATTIVSNGSAHPTTIIAKNGTWDKGSNCSTDCNGGACPTPCLANAAMPNFNCSGGTGVNGTATIPVVIKAANERQAYLKTNGSIPAFWLQNCAYWHVEGLHGESADLGAGSGGGGYSIFQFDADNHVQAKRLIAAHTNRYQNTHPIAFALGHDNLVEESEVYYFHRWGIIEYSEQNDTFRRNYSNSRNYADLACCIARNCTGNPANAGCPSIQNTTGDFGQGQYGTTTGSGTKHLNIENGISENNNAGIIISDYINDGYTSYIVGSIGLRNLTSDILIQNGDAQPYNNTLINDVAVNSSAQGFYITGSKGSILTNNTSYANTSSGVNIATYSNPGGTSGLSTTMTNVLTFNNSARGLITHNNSQGACAIVTGRSNGNGANDNEVCTGANTTTPAPSLMGTTGTNCIVYVPASSNMKGIGTGGEDIGANIIYEYTGDAPSVPSFSSSNPKVWCQSGDERTNCLAVGQFAGCGALVTGLNDDATGGSVATTACRNANLRLNMLASGGCSIP